MFNTNSWRHHGDTATHNYTTICMECPRYRTRGLRERRSYDEADTMQSVAHCAVMGLCSHYRHSISIP